MPQPKITTHSLPPLSLRAEFVRGSYDEKESTVDIVWTTGARVLRQPYFGEPFYEELSLEPGHVRLERFNNGGLPFLNMHDKWTLGAVLGRANAPILGDGKGRAKVKLSRRTDPELEKIKQDIKDEILGDTSVGYRVHKFQDVTPQDSKYKVLRAIDWEPFEVSLVTIGADGGCGINRSQDLATNPCEIILSAESAETQEDRSMPPVKEVTPAAQPVTTTTAPEPKTETPTEQQLRWQEDGAKAERERVAEIQKVGRLATNVSGDFVRNLVDKGVSVELARKAIIDEAARVQDATQPAVRGENRVELGGQDETVTRRSALESAILHRFDGVKYPLSEPGKDYRGMTLLRMAEELVGRQARGLTRTEIAERALATSDFPMILANVAGKTLRDGYAVAPQTFKPIVRIGRAPDYKEVTEVQFGAAPSLEVVNEKGEYKEGSIGEAQEKWKVVKHGKIVTITEETIVNDDLNAFVKIPMMFGLSASRLESKLVWEDVFLANPTMGDAVALFHANHGNLGAASAVNEAGLNAMKKAFRVQKDIDDKDYLDLMAAFLIVGPDKEVEARKILAGLIVASQTSNVNVHANTMGLIVENRITGNKWFGAASPSLIDTVVVGYLEGVEGPQISTKPEFTSDGIKIKCKHVVTAKAIDHRGLYYNPGA